MSLRIAIVSDLHCHPSGLTPQGSHLFSDGARVPESDHPVEALRSLISKERLQTDILLIPGDIANCVDLHGYIVGVYAVKEIATWLGGAKAIACLGNHDVDSREIHKKKQSHLLGRNLFADFPIVDPEERNRFFAEGVACVEVPGGRVLVVDSVFSHQDITEAKRGKVLPTQLDQARRLITDWPNDIYRIALCHHHPIPHEGLNLGAEDLISGGDDLISLLEQSNFDILIHGHKHQPRIRYSPSGSSRVPVFASGSLSAVLTDKLARASRNTFHILELADRESGRGTRGVVRTWEFSAQDGWVQATAQSAGVPHRCGFGYAGQIADLADRLVSVIGSQRFKPWAEIEDAVPDVRFLIPQEMRPLADELRRRGFDLANDPFAPALLGKVTQ